jgi:hypothetical protein
VYGPLRPDLYIAPNREGAARAGLVKRQRRRGTHRRRRERRPLPGRLLHIDASKHAWLETAAPTI